MNITFYRAWLPLSLAFHMALLFALNIVPMGVRTIPGSGGYYPVTMLEVALPPPEAPPQPVVKPLPPDPPAPPDQPVVAVGPRQPRLSKDVPPGGQALRPDIKSGEARRPGDGTITMINGPGIGNTPPPDIMRANNGTGYEAPAGTPGGMGTDPKGTGEGPSGPSYGAKSKYGRVSNMDVKAAGEINQDGKAVFSVQISETGKISAVTLVQKTGNAELDRIAAQLVRSNFNDYRPAMKNGTVVTDSVRVRVEFRNGKVNIEEI